MPSQIDETLPEFRDRVILITGASGGLGSAISNRLASLGSRLALVARREAPLRALQQKLSHDYDVQSCTAVADVADWQRMREVFSYAESKIGGPSAVIHTAGINIPKGILESTVKDFEEVIRTNLTGSFVVAKAAVESFMRTDQQSACLLFISSVQAQDGGRSLQYSASKAGVHGLAKSLARQVASHGIRVLVLAPGAMDTDFGRLHWSDEKRKQLEAETLIKRIASPDEIAKLAVLLVSSASSFMTGTVVHANGGARLE